MTKFLNWLKDNAPDLTNIIIALVILVVTISFNNKQLAFNQKQEEFNKKQLTFNDEQDATSKSQNERWVNFTRPQFSLKFGGGFMPDETHRKFKQRYEFQNIGELAAKNVSVRIVSLQKEIKVLEDSPVKVNEVLRGESFDFDPKFIYLESSQPVALLNKKFQFYLDYNDFEGKSYTQKIPFVHRDVSLAND